MQRVTRAVIAAAALSILAFGGVTAANAASAIPLSNGQETTDAKGGAHGKFSYTIAGSQFCYTLSVTGLTDGAVAAHIHGAPRHVAGSVLIPLVVPNETSFDVARCTTADAMLLAAIQANPRAYYVNVHTPMYPGGEVRGQLK